MSATGRCLCGAVSYTAEDVETHFHSCHCSMCRRWTGGSAMAAAVGSVAFDGAENITKYQGFMGITLQIHSGNPRFFRQGSEHLRPYFHYGNLGAKGKILCGLWFAQQVFP